MIPILVTNMYRFLFQNLRKISFKYFSFSLFLLRLFIWIVNNSWGGFEMWWNYIFCLICGMRVAVGGETLMGVQRLRETTWGITIYRTDINEDVVGWVWIMFSWGWLLTIKRLSQAFVDFRLDLINEPLDILWLQILIDLILDWHLIVNNW